MKACGINDNNVRQINEIGDEIKGFTKIQKITKSMVFLICYLESNSKIVASASGVWKKLKKNIPDFGPGG